MPLPKKQQFIKNIFLTEDDSDDREFFTEALNEIDPEINCHFAQNGKETLTKLRETNLLPDVLFLDLNMPLMNGLECLSKIKNDKRLSQLPVVIFTTSQNPDDVQATHQLGANVFLNKPANIRDLVLKLKRILTLDFKNADGYEIQYSV